MPDLTLSISLCKAYCPPQTGKGHGGGGGGYGKGGGRNEVSTFPLIGYIQNVVPDLSFSISRCIAYCPPYTGKKHGGGGGYGKGGGRNKIVIEISNKKNPS